jgi:hypothetical protein
MSQPGSRLHDMLVSWLNADSSLAYEMAQTLGSLWTKWRHGAPFDNFAIHQLLQAIDTFYGSCLAQHDETITYGEFLPTGDLQTVGDLDGALSDCP